MIKEMTFEHAMQAMNKMSPGEREGKVAELTKMCIFGKCPSYNGMVEKRFLFYIHIQSGIEMDL
jgi:hypothetical protein